MIIVSEAFEESVLIEILLIEFWNIKTKTQNKNEYIIKRNKGSYLMAL